MGKKSKRNNNKRPTCYHDCTKKEFNFGRHHKILESYDKDYKQEGLKDFCTNFQHIVSERTFGRFVIAHVTDDYLQGKDSDVLYHRLNLLLLIRYITIPKHEEKDVDSPKSEYYKNYRKYSRDITTKRGRINCIAREIPCDCMEEKRIEAKSMDKVAMCYCCATDFPKGKMLRCTGCDHVQYCSKECRTEAWPTHKKSCMGYVASSTSATTTPAASIPRSVPFVGESTTAPCFDTSMPAVAAAVAAAAAKQSGGDFLLVPLSSLIRTATTDSFSGNGIGITDDIGTRRILKACRSSSVTHTPPDTGGVGSDCNGDSDDDDDDNEESHAPLPTLSGNVLATASVSGTIDNDAHPPPPRSSYERSILVVGVIFVLMIVVVVVITKSRPLRMFELKEEF